MNAETATRADGRIRERTATAVLVTGLAGLAAITLWMARNFGFVADEWDILAHHVHGDLLTPYNGHLSLVPAGIYQAIAHTLGVGSYLPYLIVGLIAFLAIPVGFHLTHRHRTDPLLVALAALGIAWSPAADTNLLYGFLLNFDIPLVLLLVAWWAIRRNTVGSDWWAAGAVAVALASSSVGVVVAFAVVVELILARAPLRRLVRFAPPVIAWVVWWFFHHEPTTPASMGERITYAVNMLVGILAGFTLGWKPGALGSLAVIVTILVVGRRRIDAHVVAIGAALVFFVALSSFSRAGEIALNPPDASRYVFLGDLLIVAALIWCLRGVRIPTGALAAVAALVLAGATVLYGNMRDYRRFALGEVTRIQPFLAGAETAGPAADPDRILPLNLIPVTVGEYLEMVDVVGSPIAGVAVEDLGDPDARAAADELLIEDVGPLARPVGQDPSCPDPTREPADAGGPVELAPGASLLVTAGDAPSRVLVRRLAPPGHATPLDTVGAGDQIRIDAPVDRSDRAWFVEVDGAGTAVQWCSGSRSDGPGG